MCLCHQAAQFATCHVTTCLAESIGSLLMIKCVHPTVDKLDMAQAFKWNSNTTIFYYFLTRDFIQIALMNRRKCMLTSHKLSYTFPGGHVSLQLSEKIWLCWHIGSALFSKVTLFSLPEVFCGPQIC